MTVISPWRMKAAGSCMQIALSQVYNCLAHVPSECLTKLKVFQLCKFVLCVVKRPANLSMPFPLTQGYIEHRNRMSFSNVNLQRVDAGNSILCTYQPTHSFPWNTKGFLQCNNILHVHNHFSVLCPILVILQISIESIWNICIWIHCWLKVHECAMKREPMKIDTLTCLVYGWVRLGSGFLLAPGCV